MDFVRFLFVVANKHPRSIGDLPALGLDLLLTCGRCGREAVFDGCELLLFAQSRGWTLMFPLPVDRFPCRGCGARGCTPSYLQRDMRPEPMPTRPPALTPLYVRRPSAVDVLREAAELASKRQVQTDAVRTALEKLRRFVDDRALDYFWDSAGASNEIGRSQATRAALNRILRQL